MSNPLEIVPVPALRDNYAYLVHDPATKQTAVIDPSEAESVRRELARRGWKLSFILNTHHHPDHVGGNLALREEYGCPVAAPAANEGQIPGLDRPVKDGDRLRVGEMEFQAMAIPGHTLGHTAYWLESAAAVFTGDTLFLMGCGRLFEGTPAQMWSSLSKLAALPKHTQVYCGHEYTEKNGEFAQTLEPENTALRKRLAQVRELRAQGRPTVPGSLADELATNPFLRVEQPAIRRATGLEKASAAEVLGEVRRRKDSF